MGREMGYRDGSGVLQVIKRLEQVQDDPHLRVKMALIVDPYFHLGFLNALVSHLTMSAFVRFWFCCLS